MKISVFEPVQQQHVHRPAAEGDSIERGTPNGSWPTPVKFYDKQAGLYGFNQWRDEVQAAEDLNFDWVSFSEHHYGFGGLTPITTVPAAAAAEATKRIKIAIIGPVLAINNPVRMAEEIAIVDNISNGRVIVGMLRGTPNEYMVYGNNPADSRDRAIESIELMVKAWTEPQPFRWEGRHFQFPTVSVWPQPVQDPFPPSYVVSYHRESIEVAAKLGMGIGFSFQTPDTFIAGAAYYRERCAAYGWTPTPEHIIYRGRITIAESDEKAIEEVEKLGQRQRPARTATSSGRNVQNALWEANPQPIGKAEMTAYWQGKDKHEADLSKGSELGAARGNFYGNPDSIIKQVQEYSDCLGGVGVFDFFFSGATTAGEGQSTIPQMQLFAKEVMPAMREMKT